ncbi:MAG: HigA family addiction module antitoxin [Sideroxydans sp.]|nr:HigA family addiction module antitoxin [Sideroxydans sp.]
MDKLQNIHPGEILLEEFLIPMEISQTRLANTIGVPPRRINEIVLGKRGITADTALRLAQVFGTSVQFWMGLQDECELRDARETIKDQLEQMMPLAASSASQCPEFCCENRVFLQLR